MNKKRLGKKITIGDFSITPIEESSIAGNHSEYGVSVFAALKPLGILIELGDKQWALDINGEKKPVKELLAGIK